MVKFAFVCVFALFALQGLNASSLNIVQSRVVRANNEVKDLINEVNKVLASVAARKSKVIKLLDEKFTEIETTANFSGMLTELKLNINQTLAENNSTSAVCDNEAWEGLAKLEETLTSVESCRSRISDDTGNFKKQLQKIVSDVWGLLTKIASDMDDCIRSAYGSYQKFIECVQSNVGYAIQKLKIYNKAMQDIFDVIEAFMPVYTNTMTNCVDNIKLELVNKEKELIEDVQHCVKIN